MGFGRGALLWLIGIPLPDYVFSWRFSCTTNFGARALTSRMYACL